MWTWVERWSEKAHIIASGQVDWNHFRRDRNLMRGLETFQNEDPPHVWADWCGRRGVPFHLWVDTLAGDPEATTIQGFPVTQTSLRHAIYVWACIESVDWHRPLNVLEIGAGFGGFAASLCQAVDVAEYHIIDATPCLKIQSEFFRLCEKTRGTAIYFHEDAEWEWPEFDLVVNTNSFGEMTPAEVAEYFEAMQRELRDGAVLYTVNRTRRQVSFAEFPYDGNWTHAARHFLGDPTWVECVSRRALGASSPHPVRQLEVA